MKKSLTVLKKSLLITVLLSFGTQNVYANNITNESFLISKSNIAVKKSKSVLESQNINRIIYLGDFLGILVKDKYGVIDENGNQIIEPKFDEITGFKDGFATASIDKKWGLINEKGDFIVEPKYNYLAYVGKGIYSALINEKMGLINEKGDFIIEPKYDFISNYNLLKRDSGLYIVTLNKKNGIINKKGDIILEINYDSIKLLTKNTTSIIKSNDKYGVIDENGKVIIEPKLDNLPILNDSNITYFVKEKSKLNYKDGNPIFNKKYGLLDNTGKVIVEAKFDFLAFQNGVGIVKVENKWGVINQKGNFIINPKFEDIDLNGFKNDLLVVKSGNKWGVIDQKGNFIITPKYDELYFGSNYKKHKIGYFSLNKKYGIIDRNGKVIVKPKYDYIQDLITYNNEKPLIKVLLNEKVSIIDKTGKVIVAPKYDDIEISREYLITNNNNRYGLLNSKGETILEEKYPRLIELVNNIFIFNDEKNSYFFNAKSNKTYKLLNKVLHNLAGSSLKENMHTFQTMLETYAVDHEGVYPQNISELIIEAKSSKYGSYYKKIMNPLDAKLQGLADKKSDIKGVVIYEPIKDSKGNITIYKIFANDKTGQHLKDKSNSDFYLTNN